MGYQIEITWSDKERTHVTTKQVYRGSLNEAMSYLTFEVETIKVTKGTIISVKMHRQVQ